MDVLFKQINISKTSFRIYHKSRSDHLDFFVGGGGGGGGGIEQLDAYSQYHRLHYHPFCNVHSWQ